jgi:hypothetical protein
MVMDRVTDIIVTVMDEIIDDDECDVGDGIIKKSSKSKNQAKPLSKCNTSNQEQKSEKEILKKVLEMPSSSSQQEARSHTGQDIEDSQSTITVGDLVTVENAPSYWSWASPFTVRAIESEMVALDMVDELIEIGRLQKCQK